MLQRALPSAAASRITVASLVAAVFGLLLFVYTLDRAGLRAILQGVSSVGVSGFLAILGLQGVRLCARSLAWARCVEGRQRLGLRDAFTASVMGEALGNATPLAVVLSEPAKAALVGRQVPLATAFSALIVENIVYAVSIALMIALGAVAFLVSFDMPYVLRVGSLVSIGAVAAIIAAAYAILGARARPVSGVIGWLDRKRLAPKSIAKRRERIQRFEERLNLFFTRNQGRLGPVAALEASFHVAGVAEVYLTLLLIGKGAGAGLLAALVLESTGRLVNVVFRFIPLRLGVDEAGAGLLANVLRLGTATGVTLAVVRKARVLCWTAVGLALLLHRGLSVRRALDQARSVAATRPES